MEPCQDHYSLWLVQGFNRFAVPTARRIHNHAECLSIAAEAVQVCNCEIDECAYLPDVCAITVHEYSMRLGRGFIYELIQNAKSLR